MSIMSNFLKQLVQGDQIKDWDHASRLFVANSYELAPKSSFLFHVFFDLNPNISKMNGMELAHTKQIELGMMVKQISLPKFTVQTKVLNAYNRANIHQTKIQYDPVNVTFNDDSADVVRNFWFDYYNYYYRDSDYGGSTNTAMYASTHSEMAGPKVGKDWGYTLRGSTTGATVTEPYLRSIRIYSLHNKKFSEYILVNPIIKSFAHGEHNTAGSTDTMQHQMTIEYETVLYSYGHVGRGVQGFGDLHYDKRPSPLTPAGGGTQSILGPGGIVETASEIVQDLSSGNFGAALFKGARVTNGLKGANLGAMAAATALQLGKDIIRSSSSGQNSFYVPTVGSLINGASNGISNAASGLATKAESLVSGFSGVTAVTKNTSVTSEGGTGQTGGYDYI